MPIKTTDLISRINLIFADTDPVASSEVPGDSYAVNQYLNGRRWQDVTAKSMLENMHDSPESYLSHLKPLGFCYYLPAYMLMVLQEWRDDTCWLYENLPSHLTPSPFRWNRTALGNPSTTTISDSDFLRKIAPLTPEQKNCVADFLSHQILHEGPSVVTTLRLDALNAYNAYWHQFASQPYIPSSAG